MAHMRPIATYMTRPDCIEESEDTFRCDTCGDPCRQYNVTTSSEGQFRCLECDPPTEGWYARLSAPGYMDCTDWMGPYPTEAEALQAVQDHYEVDENGDETVCEDCGAAGGDGGQCPYAGEETE